MRKLVGRVAPCCICAALLGLGAEAKPGPIGLVLSGGAAKGAYEVGVWKELQASGLAPRVTAISGTSVGAINAALFATTPDAAEKIWLESICDVFTLNTNRVGQALQKGVDMVSDSVRVAEETGEDWQGALHLGLSVLVQVADKMVEANRGDVKCEGYIDSSRLAALLDANLPRRWPAHAPTVYATAVEKGVDRSVTWRLNGESHERRNLKIRASAALPEGFDNVLVDGRIYVDGGWTGGDNTPIGPILENHPEIKTIFVVYLNDGERLSAGTRNRIRAAADRADVRLVEIIPSRDIDGPFGIQALNPSPEKAEELISLGRRDAREALGRLDWNAAPSSGTSAHRVP